ncbi:MAG: HD domain-containing protein [Candidatus Brocadiaceae bacterium]|nr:HD domain-containing protein [Candidatus Brocadiaceae bacterium]
MHGKLIPLKGAEHTEVIELSTECPVVFGRGESCTVRLSQGSVSRRHCRIAHKQGFFTVEDLESSNGTWVNDHRVRKALLFHHDRIAIGDAEFRFVLEDTPRQDEAVILTGDTDTPPFGTEVRAPAGPAASGSPLGKGTGGDDPSIEEDIERHLSAVCRVIDSVAEERNLDRLFAAIMDNVMEVMGADRGYLIAARELNGVLIPLLCRYREGLPAAARNSFSRSIVVECHATGDSILRSAPADRVDASLSVVSQGIRSVLCSPMRDGEGAVGFLYVDNVVGSREFTERDLKVLAAIGNQAGIAVRRAQLAHQVETVFGDVMRSVLRLVEFRDSYTCGHCERVTALALCIGGLMPESRPDRRTIEIAGMLHDVGKLAVQLDVLQKPDSLTESEYETVKQHPAAGAAILSSVDNAAEIASAIRHHHERWDGTGYPDGLAGEDIPLVARLLALADAFDSMATERPYKSALPPEKILGELDEGAGTQFDPHLVRLVMDALRTGDAFREEIQSIYRDEGGMDRLDDLFRRPRPSGRQRPLVDA